MTTSELIASSSSPITTITPSPPAAPNTRTPSAASGKSVYDGHSATRFGRTGPTRSSLGVDGLAFDEPLLHELERAADRASRGEAVDIVEQHFGIVVLGKTSSVELAEVEQSVTD